jgi:MFS family permease
MNTTPPPLPARVDRTPILYSALIYPGVGQYMMGRKTVGVICATCFTIALAIFVAFFIRFFSEAVHVVKATWAGTYLPEEGMPSRRALFMPLVYVLLVYLANVYDVTWHLYRPLLTKQGDTQTN